LCQPEAVTGEESSLLKRQLEKRIGRKRMACKRMREGKYCKCIQVRGSATKA
jgi:hypothetical protein